MKESDLCQGGCLRELTHPVKMQRADLPPDRECARRRRQIAEGKLKIENGLDVNPVGRGESKVGHGIDRKPPVAMAPHLLS